MRFATANAGTSMMRRAAASGGAALLIGLIVGACSIDGEQFFGHGVGGAGGDDTVATSGSGGSTSSTTTTTTHAATTTTTSTTTSTTTGGSVCGDGLCEPGEEATCPDDCGAGCEHPVCNTGNFLALGCDPCVDQVCAQDGFCCDTSWDGQCVAQADELCNAGCCGDGTCDGEDCASCPLDCGGCVCGDNQCQGEDCVSCPGDCGACQCGDNQCQGEDCNSCPGDCGPCQPPATCPHSVCFAGAALDTTLCTDSCVDEVCMNDASCCSGPEGWTPQCAVDALAMCGGDPCITAVCAQNAACCTTAWDQGCVDLAKTTCNTACNCAHGICQAGGGALTIGCNPCVDAVCAVDDYCCNADWDGICVGEVATVCLIDC